MPYNLRSAPTLNTLSDVRAWVEEELGYIEQAQSDITLLHLQPVFQDVDKPRDGMIVYADGIHFNPGTGAGSYEYRSGAWHKLADDIDVGELETDITDLETAVAANTAAIATKSNIIGVTNGSNAAAGNVGEYLSSFRVSGSALNLTSGVDTQIVSLALTAGDWDLSGEVFALPTAATITGIGAGINTVVNSAPAAPADGVDSARSSGLSTTALQTLSGLRTRINITSPTTYLLVMFASFGGTSVGGYGALRARRMR